MPKSIELTRCPDLEVLVARLLAAPISSPPKWPTSSTPARRRLDERLARASGPERDFVLLPT